MKIGKYETKIFSYGTLQYESVQLSTFGRKLIGQKDILSSYKITMIAIKDNDVITKSGIAEHPMLIYTGQQHDTVEGIVFDITEEELIQADKYEVSDYKRVYAELISGSKAWVYVKNANPG